MITHHAASAPLSPFRDFIVTLDVMCEMWNASINTAIVICLGSFVVFLNVVTLELAQGLLSSNDLPNEPFKKRTLLSSGHDIAMPLYK